MGRPSVRTHIDAEECGANDEDKSDSMQLRSGHVRGGPERKRLFVSGGRLNFEPTANESRAGWCPQALGPSFKLRRRTNIRQLRR